MWQSVWTGEDNVSSLLSLSSPISLILFFFFLSLFLRKKNYHYIFLCLLSLSPPPKISLFRFVSISVYLISFRSNRTRVERLDSGRQRAPPAPARSPPGPLREVTWTHPMSRGRPAFPLGRGSLPGSPLPESMSTGRPATTDQGRVIASRCRAYLIGCDQTQFACSVSVSCFIFLDCFVSLTHPVPKSNASSTWSIQKEKKKRKEKK